MSERDEVKAPERIWIDWPRKQADDAWYWMHDEYGDTEYIRADLARSVSPSEGAQRAAEEIERDHIIYFDSTNLSTAAQAKLDKHRQETRDEITAIITKHIQPSPSLADAVKEVERLRDEWAKIPVGHWQRTADTADEIIAALKALQPVAQPEEEMK